MTAIALKCTKVSMHPNADKLSVYKFSDGSVDYDIVANQENTYVIGDVAVVVLGGTLKTGEVIRPTNVRGVISLGMAMGKTNVDVGTDLSDLFLQSESPNEHCFIPWTDIEQVYNVRKYIADGKIPSKTVSYRGKIKLDGTNTAVQILPNGSVKCQSRNRFITPEDDQNGFARWAQTKEKLWAEAAKKTTKRITIFGEWCGHGIQKRCSISHIGKKIFAIFAILEGDQYIVDPGEIWDIIDVDDDVKILGWHGDVINVDYSNRDQMQLAIDAINKMVDDVEACDPWVKAVFGVEGLGEGIVFYPMPNSDGRILKIEYDSYVFKAKGEKHQVVNNKKPAQLEPEKAESIDGFVKLFVTEPRLEQFATKVGIDQKKIGDFLKAFCTDVEKESEAELAASNMTWSEVAKAIAAAARKWYIAQVNK
jgi:tRNA-binding EMAP/Myf-like protein